MARLIEFFTRTGELVLDPFAGVGGTLLGAAIARGPRRAIGIELEPRWVDVYDDGRRASSPASATARDRSSRISARATQAARAASTRPAASCGWATRSRCCRPCRRVDRLRRDRSALQRPAAADDGGRQAGGGVREPADRLRDGHRLTRRTSRTPPTTRRSSTGWATSSGRSQRVLRRAVRGVIVRDAYQDGRYLFTGADLAARAAATGSSRRAT